MWRSARTAVLASLLAPAACSSSIVSSNRGEGVAVDGSSFSKGSLEEVEKDQHAPTSHSSSSNNSKPNILFILTDDQDLYLDSMRADGPCQTILGGIAGHNGTQFSNAFANTPICCPSRAEITTGRYMHNTQVFGNSCGGTAFIEGPEKQNVAALLKAAQPDYATFYAGKYLNNYGAPHVGGVARIPPGWDEWYGLVGNSKYYDYSVSNNGVEEKHGNDYAQDYFTDRVANRSVEFMQSALSAGKPFFMQVATPASHEPNTPAPQYNETYAGMRAPRLPSFNVTGQKDKNFLLRDIVPMDERHANVSDVVFQRRWSTLRSVDDMVGRFLAILSEAEQLANTFIIYSSDHGYHLGEFGMIYDKRTLYETDVRVPLLVRGPGIATNQTVAFPVGHVDIAPTILDMAGVAAPSIMDGRSWLPLVSVAVAHANSHQTREAEWRTQFMVEYSGGNVLPNSENQTAVLASHGKTCVLPSADDVGCHSQYWPDEVDQEDVSFGISVQAPACHANVDDELSMEGKCSCSIGAVEGGDHDINPCDGKNNTYACVRTLSNTTNTMYCEFNDPEHFVEYYDLTVDPYNLNNLVANTSAAELAELHANLLKHQSCQGADCFVL